MPHNPGNQEILYAQDKNGDAPIHVAAKKRQRAFVELLIDRGAEFDYNVCTFFMNGWG
jgi:ankyrin repeat protein